MKISQEFIGVPAALILSSPYFQYLCTLVAKMPKVMNTLSNFRLYYQNETTYSRVTCKFVHC